MKECNKPSLLILGAGGFGRVVHELAEDTEQYERICFLDDASTGTDVVGQLKDYKALHTQFECAVVAIGNNSLRLEWLKKLAVAGYRLPVLKHPTAWVSRGALVEHGTIILQMAVVNTGAKVERGCIINCGAVVDHDCTVKAGCHVCLNSVVKNQGTLPTCTKLEAGVVYEPAR